MYNLQHPVKMISWFSDQLKNPKNMYEMKKKYLVPRNDND